jgi:hypothetical protein
MQNSLNFMSTCLKVVDTRRNGLAEALKRNSDAVAPYKLLPDVVRGVKTVVRHRLELFVSNAAAVEQ